VKVGRSSQKFEFEFEFELDRRCCGRQMSYATLAPNRAR